MIKYKELAHIVHFHRKQAGLSRRELSELAGVSETVIYYLEHGKETLQWNIVTAILKSLNVQIVLNSPLMDVYEKSKGIDAQ